MFPEGRAVESSMAWSSQPTGWADLSGSTQPVCVWTSLQVTVLVPPASPAKESGAWGLQPRQQLKQQQQPL